jgi:hypothetical protein
MNNVTPTIEKLIKMFAQPCFSLEVTSYPSGCCNNCRKELYCRQRQERKGEEVLGPREEWTAFQLELVRVWQMLHNPCY